MSDDSLLPHLLDIISDPASEGLILAGGYGLRLKQQSIIERGERTLIAEVPAARATQDLDFFLRLELFVQKERGLAVRDLLHRLSYTEHTPDWQFGKPGGNPGDGPVKVDLLARLRLEGEPVRVKAHRVGSRAGVGLHGYRTPEAFAVEDAPISLRVAGQGSTSLLINLKVQLDNAQTAIPFRIALVYEASEKRFYLAS